MRARTISMILTGTVCMCIGFMFGLTTTQTVQNHAVTVVQAREMETPDSVLLDRVEDGVATVEVDCNGTLSYYDFVVDTETETEDEEIYTIRHGYIYGYDKANECIINTDDKYLWKYTPTESKRLEVGTEVIVCFLTNDKETDLDDAIDEVYPVIESKTEKGDE